MKFSMISESATEKNKETDFEQKTVPLEEQDKSSYIEQQPAFGDRK